MLIAVRVVCTGLVSHKKLISELSPSKLTVSDPVVSPLQRIGVTTVAKIFSIISKSGSVNVEDVLPDPDTVKLTLYFPPNAYACVGLSRFDVFSAEDGSPKSQRYEVGHKVDVL